MKKISKIKAGAAKPKPEPVAVIEQETDERQYGARLSLAKACPFCKHAYLKPCSEKTKESCPNYQHLKGGKRGNK